MTRLIAPCLLGLLLAGCEGREPSEIVLSPEYINVIDLQGQEGRVPSGQLVHPDSGEPAVRSVLAIDRRTGKRGWVPVERILDDAVGAPRYLPVTESCPEVTEQ